MISLERLAGEIHAEPRMPFGKSDLQVVTISGGAGSSVEELNVFAPCFLVQDPSIVVILKLGQLPRETARTWLLVSNS